jgi:hypothetical protein
MGTGTAEGLNLRMTAEDAIGWLEGLGMRLG